MTTVFFKVDDPYADNLPELRQLIGARVRANKSGKEFTIANIDLWSPVPEALSATVHAELSDRQVISWGELLEHFTFLQWGEDVTGERWNGAQVVP